MLTWGKTIILTSTLLIALLVSVLFMPECRADYKWHRGMQVPITRYDINVNKYRNNNHRRGYYNVALPYGYANNANKRFKQVRKTGNSNPYFNRKASNPYFKR